MKSRNTISACLVVYNEERYIKRCLESIKNSVDEIILVHDGECYDETINIASQYTDKIYVREHIGIAEPHRVEAINLSCSDWILWIDADEFLSTELSTKIQDLVKNSNCDGYEFIWPLWNGKKYLTNDWPWRPALFRKSKLQYIGFPQEPFKSKGTVKKIPLVINHQPTYNNYTVSTFIRKHKKWAKIHATWLLKSFETIPKYNVSENEWSKRQKFAINHSYLFLMIGLYTFAGCQIYNRPSKRGWIGLKIDLIWSSYISLVYLNLTIMKLKRLLER